MLESTENLCESVTVGFAMEQPKTDWNEEVYLAQACKERFLTQSDLPELTDNGFFMAGLAELAEGYEIERVSTTNHTLLLTQEGAGLLTLAERQYHLMPNTLTILPAGQPFRFELADKKKGWKMAWVLLKPTDKWLPLVANGQRVEHTQICEQVWSVMNLLHSEVGGRASYRKLFASELSRLMLGSANLAPSNSVLRVQSVFNDIESQLHLNWTVKGIAKQCFLSTEQLNRITKQLYNCSTQQRLIQLRMEKAVDLLYYQEWTIGMVAQRLGYQDPFNFTHRFRQYHGCSPREYRKRLFGNE
ncbi:AraC family transcriptional regulator [Photobacterium rosenbergii]|uniref:AraC family transcriptional regulator n=1 Tax=Photobacterium rosenbergii TaxID=294936 RepID=A0A2T3NK71_9GAMM|nr:AraC family transcriptional regulator [Photobacterium rosenbergii]PSW15842.1 AraC family transcriptional regulator [Photobacterium rosenbergii]